MQKQIATNKKAYFDYFINEKFEAGISLLGSEVKSLRAGKVNIRDAFISIEKSEIFIKQMHISPYEKANSFKEINPTRVRKLLMHKKEIGKLAGTVAEKGLTLVPTQLYFKNGKVKVEIAIAQGKKLYDKRNTIKERDEKRRIERGNYE